MKYRGVGVGVGVGMGVGVGVGLIRRCNIEREGLIHIIHIIHIIFIPEKAVLTLALRVL
jgi:hypothetical protein